MNKIFSDSAISYADTKVGYCDTVTEYLGGGVVSLDQGQGTSLRRGTGKEAGRQRERK